MAYATFSDLNQAVGRGRLQSIVPDSDGATVEDLGDAALEAAAGEIDSALAAGGEAVPIVTSAISDATAQTRTAALLRDLNVKLAWARLAIGGREISGALETEIAWAREFLTMLRKGTAQLPDGTDGPGSGFVFASAAAVPAADDVTDRRAAAGAY